MSQLVKINPDIPFYTRGSRFIVFSSYEDAKKYVIFGKPIYHRYEAASYPREELFHTLFLFIEDINRPGKNDLEAIVMDCKKLHFIIANKYKLEPL